MLGILAVQGEERENKYRFSDDGSVTISGYAMALTMIIKEVGVCHAFCFSQKVKKKIWVLLCAHHSLITIKQRNCVRKMQVEFIVCMQ